MDLYLAETMMDPRETASETRRCALCRKVWFLGLQPISFCGT